MAQQRLTDRTALNEAPANDDLIHIVDISDTTDNASGTSKKITVQNLISSAIGSIPTEQPIENTYADITALLADQANQTTGFIQKVEDASDDPNVDSGRAYYEKLASTTATLATDYTLISDTQATALDVSDIFTFTVQSVGTSVPSNAGGGKIRVQYTALDSKVDFVIFNKQFSFYLDGLVAAQDTYAESVSYSVTFYNTTQSTAVTFKNVDWEDLGAYVKMNAAYSNVDYTNFVADDIVKVVISAHDAGGGGSGTVTSVAISGSDGIEVDSGSPITSSGTITLGLNKTNTLTFLNVEDGAEVNTINSTTAGEPTGSDVVTNVVSLTQAEYDAGTPNASTLYVITDAKDDAEIMFACSDENSSLTADTSVFTFRMPYAMTVTEVRANVKTAPTGANIEVDINEGGVSILSTVLSIDAGEKTSTTAATPAVISDSLLADDAEITIDIDQIGSTVAGSGLKVTLIGKKA